MDTQPITRELNVSEKAIICLDMPKRYRRYVFDDAGKFFSGRSVTWKRDGRQWIIYDADAEGSGFLLRLVSPEYNFMVRNVDPTEVEL